MVAGIPGGGGTVTEREQQIRDLVQAAIKVHEGLKSAEETLESLYPDRPDMGHIQKPYTGNDDFTLLMEAAWWVDFETTFRDRKKGESEVEWLRAYLRVDSIAAAAIAVVKKKGSISDLRKALREGKVI